MHSFIARLGRFIAALALGQSLAMAGTISINIFISVGPSIYSPNFQTYALNAEQGIQNGGTAVGTPGTPGYYSSSPANVATQLDSGCFITSTTNGSDGFNSWCAQAPPPAGYASELGNQVYLGTAITDSGGTFTLNDVGLTSATLGNNSLAGTTFGFTAQGGDQIGFNGATEFSTSSGAAADDSQPLTALYASGIGNSFQDNNATNYCVDFGPPTGNVCGNLAFWADNATFGTPGTYGFTYSVQGTDQSDSFSLVTPEPGAWLLILPGLSGLVGFRRKLFRVSL